MNQANNLEEFVAGGMSELKALASEQNEVAQIFLDMLEKMGTTHEKLYFFGEIKVLLMRDDIGPQSMVVKERLCP